ncbi:Protein of unknown function (DUF604) [Melia azedarach]|uniref:Uncharacterized protein n=1 Tax=Melia azedarach TaxID=155640 RepID=A0ACC1YLH9_MELAZ|nr:Protein of unknown function (DUF604) [Melia azedarach]
MSSSTSTHHFSPIQHLPLATFYTSIAISGLTLFLLCTLYGGWHYSYIQNNDLFMPFIGHKLALASPPNVTTNTPTNINNIMFVLVGSIRTWKYRKSYIEAWWRENKTRGNIWLDVDPTQELLPWPSSSPPFRVNEDIRNLKVYPKLVSPVQVRIYRSVLETFRLGDNKDVRWFVMADDDTLIFLDNLVEVLGKYDHTKYYYIGTNSECIQSNYDFSFHMGYGGAGYALSYALVEALASRIDGCIERYPHLYVSDYLSHSCSADLGADLTIEKGMHQIDLHGDISGLLSSHPNTPLLTLHHFDFIDPIFPSKNSTESVNHLMKAANVDQSRLLQQTICYHRQTNWTFSLSWGYSVHIYETIFPRSILRKPLETFQPWKKVPPPLYMFNTRWPTNDPCEAPHVFFMETVQSSEGSNELLTSYTRSSPRNLPVCSLGGNHSADSVVNIQVFSPATGRKEAERIECCDVDYMADKGIAEVKLRACMKGEMLA